MRKYLLLITLVASIVNASEDSLSSTADAKTYVYELEEPSVRITLPNLPRIEMEPHPLNAEEPHMRVAGSHDRIGVAISTPASEAGMTPIECAAAVADAILAQNSIEPEHAFKGRADDSTYLLIYGLAGEDFVLLNAHILSAAEDDYCIDVHVSKVSTSEADIKPWFSGFGESRIEE